MVIYKTQYMTDSIKVSKCKFDCKCGKDIKSCSCDGQLGECVRMDISSPKEAIVLILLLMMDQFHDFGEGLRSGAISSGVKQESKEVREKNMDNIRKETREFIEKFTDSSGRTVFKDFIEGDSEFSELYSKIFDSEINKLLSKEKYEISGNLVKSLSIVKQNFEELDADFNNIDDSYYPNFSCNNIKNIFYHYLIYSGYIENGELSKKLRITIDAHGSKFDISPLLNNICDFIFSDEYSFYDVKLVRSIATEYDAAGTQGAEVYIKKLEEKKNERIEYIKNVLDREIVKLDVLKLSQSSNRKRSRDDDISTKIKNTEFAITQMKSDLKKIESKNITVDIDHFDRVKNNNGFEKVFQVSFRGTVFIKYSLELQNNSIVIDLNSSKNRIIDSLTRMSKSNIEGIYNKFLISVYEKLKIKDDLPSTISSVVKLINQHLKSNGIECIKIPYSWFKFIKYENYIEDLFGKLKLKSGLKKTKYKYYTKGNLVEPEHKIEFDNLKKKVDSYDNKEKHQEVLDNIYKSLQYIKGNIGINEMVVTNVVVIPRIYKWLNYSKIKLAEARKNLIMDENELKTEFRQGGLSQSYIVKTLNSPSVNNKDYIYYYIFKTIGDLSQILECSHGTFNTRYNDDTVNIFLTFDGICGYISSLFNRTILEESDKEKNILFNLKTFRYVPKNNQKMIEFNRKYRQYLAGIRTNLTDEDVSEDLYNILKRIKIGDNIGNMFEPMREDIDWEYVAKMFG